MMDSLSPSRSWSGAAAGGGRLLEEGGRREAEGGPSCFADEKTVEGVSCLAKARLREPGQRSGRLSGAWSTRPCFLMT